MVLRGTLAPERFGYSMPVDAPLYPRPPLHFPDAQFLAISYETDPDAAAGALPADVTVPSPALVQITVAHYPSSSVGTYTEAAQMIPCQWEGQTRSFVSRILLDNDAAIAAGREIYGFPKKHAFVELRRDGDSLVGILERPPGHRLLTATMTIGDRLDAPAGRQGGGGLLNLRIIPDIEDSGKPSVMELAEVNMPSTIKEVWSGSGSLEFGPPSEADPWSSLPVRRLLAASYMVLDFELAAGRVLKRY